MPEIRRSATPRGRPVRQERGRHGLVDQRPVVGGPSPASAGWSRRTTLLDTECWFSQRACQPRVAISYLEKCSKSPPNGARHVRSARGDPGRRLIRRPATYGSLAVDPKGEDHDAGRAAGGLHLHPRRDDGPSLRLELGPGPRPVVDGDEAGPLPSTGTLQRRRQLDPDRIDPRDAGPEGLQDARSSPSVAGRCCLAEL